MTAAAELDEALDRAGIPVKGADLLAALAEIGAGRLVQLPLSGTPLNQHEAEVLARSSGVNPDPGAPMRVRARATAAMAMQYAEAKSTGQVAADTGRSASRIRHMARERRLYALPVDRRRGLLFPAWQFGPSGQPLPGLADVLAALPPGLHPLEVFGFFSTPTMELSLDNDTPASPLEWLLAAGDEQPVVELARAVGEAA
jgi:hypothetical protein